MDVEHSLPRRGVTVEDRAVSCIGVPPLARNLLRDEVHFAYQLAVRRLEVVERCDVLARYDEHMRRRLWIDVVECQY